MKTKFNHSVAIVGSGKVATALAITFHQRGIKITGIWSRSFENSVKLAKKVKSSAIEKIGQLKADIILFAVKDDVIAKLATKITDSKALLLHTSGTVSLSVFKQKKNACGVFYPLQTFTGKGKIDFSKIPLLIEGDSKNTEKIIFELAKQICKNVTPVHSAQRKKIHLAAVLVSNFPNFLYVLAEKLLKEEKLSFEILLPLIHQVTDNMNYASPSENQTGPAIRGDKKTMKDHTDLLRKNPEIKKIYQLLSKSIMNHDFTVKRKK